MYKNFETEQMVNLSYSVTYITYAQKLQVDFDPTFQTPSSSGDNYLVILDLFLSSVIVVTCLTHHLHALFIGRIFLFHRLLCFAMTLTFIAQGQTLREFLS